MRCKIRNAKLAIIILYEAQVKTAPNCYNVFLSI